VLRDRLMLALDRVAFAERALAEERPKVILQEWQKSLLRSTSERILLNCSRQSGKSSLVAVLALHCALYHPASLVLCLAPALRQSQELFDKVLRFYRVLGRPVVPKTERKLSLELENGSRVVALPGTEKTIRGFSNVALLILDEASWIEDTLYYAVRPMLAVSGGALMMLSTPYGRRGIFYEEWEEGTEWERYRIPADQCPYIPKEFLEKERRTKPEWYYAQEYNCEFRETEDQLWTFEMIEGARDDELEEFTFEGDEDLWKTP